MKRLFKAGALALCLMFAGTASAKPGNQAFVKIPFNEADGTTFVTEDMTGPAQTAVLDVRGFTWVTFYLSILSVSGTANVTVNCNTGPTSADVNYSVQSESVAAGVSTFSDYVPTKSVTTSDKYPVTFNVVNKGYLQCTFTCASGTVDGTLYAW